MTLTAAFPDASSVYLADTVGGGVPVAPVRGFLRAEVISTFSTGFYVRDDQRRIFAIGGPNIPAGPIHLVLKHPAPQPKTGSEVRIGRSVIDLGTVAISLNSARPFNPYHPSPHDLALATTVLSGLFNPHDVPGDIEPVHKQVISALDAGDLDAARCVLQGRGDGLTPSGDDVLAGLLLFHAWSGTTTANLHAIAQRTRTNDLSRAFLAWAARGQSIQPVHDLVHTAFKLSLEIRAEPTQRLRAELTRSVQTLRGIGHSSGVALLTGLSLAAQLYWKSVRPSEAY